MTNEESETERLAQAYAGEDFRKSRPITIEVLTRYGNTVWNTPHVFLEIISDAITLIPKDATNAKVILSGGYDEGCSLIISYEGLEDEATVCERVNSALSHARNNLDCERQEFERLKAKFEPAKFAPIVTFTHDPENAAAARLGRDPSEIGEKEDKREKPAG